MRSTIERRQNLSRVRVPEARAAELLRILYELKPGLGENITEPRVYDRLVKRRAIDTQMMYDVMGSTDGTVLTRPMKSSITLVQMSADLLLAMGFVRKLGPRLFAITELGREEAEAYFPGLRPPANGHEVQAQQADGHHSSR